MHLDKEGNKPREFKKKGVWHKKYGGDENECG
jgi:hypothetical protein